LTVSRTNFLYAFDDNSGLVAASKRRNSNVHMRLRTLLAIIGVALPQSGRAVTLDSSEPPGKNYDKAEFRLWYPNQGSDLHAIVVLLPGSNEDGRIAIANSTWQAFAMRHDLALLGCHFTDKLHKQMFIESYVNVSQGSGNALLTAIAKLSKSSSHPELSAAPLLLWGISAGGEFNYEFVAWKPRRVVGFVVNKGGIYYTALLPEAAREVPGIFFTGDKDLESRTQTIVGLFALNRRAGALWGLIHEPNVGHEIGQSLNMALLFFEDVLTLRVRNSQAAGNPLPLASIAESSGLIGDLNSKTFRPDSEGPSLNQPTSWFPTVRVARAWENVVNGRAVGDP
jgi:hypothetical protein